MKHLAARIGTVLFPLITAFTLAACTDSSSPSSADDDTSGDDSMEQPDQPIVAGDLDKTFGTNGIKELDIGSGNAAALAMQGSKVLVCYTAVTPTGAVGHVARFTADGSLDPSFATGGVYTFTGEVLPASGCADVTVQRDGIIVMSLHVNNTNYSLPLSSDGTLIASSYPVGYTTRLASMHTNDGIMGAAFNNGAIDFTSHTNADPANASSVPANISAVGALLLSPIDWPIVVANAQDATGQVWQLLAPGGASMQSLNSIPTVGTSAADLIHGALWLQDGSILAFGGVDNDREVLAVQFPLSGTATVEHHASSGVAQAHAGAIDAAGGTILVGSAGPVGKPQFAWQRYTPNSVTLDAAYQQAGIATLAAPSGSAELVDVTEANGSLYALGTFDTETAAPRMVLLKITE